MRRERRRSTSVSRAMGPHLDGDGDGIGCE
ncbi:MAG: hypothetical protein GEV08_05485 [Acidimicrobiia bacterium]|nr:hypothetical protein [Acidimicrobiia bacterium]